jgi:hypothetical protein
MRELIDLDEDARAISDRRRDLHRRIDALYLRAPLDDEQVTQLDLLENEERIIVAERRELHMQIDVLRVQVGLPRSRDAQWVATAARPRSTDTGTR